MQRRIVAAHKESSMDNKDKNLFRLMYRFGVDCATGHWTSKLFAIAVLAVGAFLMVKDVIKAIGT
jgi:hypothetical protein